MKRKKDPVKQHLLQDAKSILRFLRKRRKNLSPLLILTHDYPDPDALASACALQYLAQEICGINSRIAYGGVIGRMENREMVRLLKLPVHQLRSGDLKKYAHIVLVDTQPFFENNSFPKNRRPAMIIDQHASVIKPAAEHVVVNTECGATSVILAKCLALAGLDVPVQIATALAYGILSDTLGFYRCHHQEVIDNYLFVLAKTDLKALAKIQHPERSRNFFTTLTRGVHHAMMRRGLIISHLGVIETPDLVSQIADSLLTYEDAGWTLCTGRYKGKLHVSLRTSRPNAQAGEILRDIFPNRGEAGGHDLIAGGSFKIGLGTSEANWREAEQFLVQRLLKRLKLPQKGDFAYPFRQVLTPAKKWSLAGKSRR